MCAALCHAVQVIERWVVPVTAQHGRCRMAELVGTASGLSPSDIGPPQHVISTPEHSTVDLVLRTAERALAGADPQATRVWVRFLAASQHVGTLGYDQDLEAKHRAVEVAQVGARQGRPRHDGAGSSTGTLAEFCCLPAGCNRSF